VTIPSIARSIAFSMLVLGCGTGSDSRMVPPSGQAGASGAAGSSVIAPPMQDAAASPSDAGTGCDGASACTLGCGNGRLDPGSSEQCDDANDVPGDGCSKDCKLEQGWTCPQPGSPCVNLVVCGDGRIGFQETCDDGNTKNGDGCSSACKLEPGWDCPVMGMPCIGHCGDGVLTPNEQCDPPNPSKGCSATCQIEPGYACDAPPVVANPTMPASCHLTVCGDGTKEAAEACDDGNRIDGDGCSSRCSLEPACATGECVSKCGDGIRLPGEACDDGNTKDGDGCSHDCIVERGWACTDSASELPAQLGLAVTYRDFISEPTNGASRHPDFQTFSGHGTTGLVLEVLDADGKPEMEGRCSVEQPSTFSVNTICPDGQQLTTRTNFHQWYRDTADVNVPIHGVLALIKSATVANSYAFDSGSGFFPIDKMGWTAPPVRENLWGGHDFGFTTELRYFLQYRGGESLVFSGDDDVWVFVNRKLAIDLGGLHPEKEATLNLDASSSQLGLVVGHIYEVVLFHAERKEDKSNFHLTLTGFGPASSRCQTRCGDGVVAGGEQCDRGSALNTGAYGGCTADCTLGPRCGDAVLQSANESCDDGYNLTLYGMNGTPGCAPGCVWSAFCGDGQVDARFGEECDLGRGKNTGGYGGCAYDCRLGPRCGDGVVQPSEQCDDGNTVSGDGCSYNCESEVPR
jgi:fibro-slime domain-containing protein